MARQPGEPPLPFFLGISAWASLLTFGLYWRTRRSPPGAVPVARLISWAVVFRLCGLVGGPFYEDDFYRYLWDAHRFAQDGTPYGVAPEAFFTDPAVPEMFRRILDQVNYPELPTIYGPVTELLFLAGHAVRPGSITVLQAMLILADVLAIVLLLRLAPPRSVLLYAWCPLVVKEIAFTAHPDGIAVCLLLGAVVLARRDRMRIAAACLGLAVAAKVLALLLVPFVLARARLADWATFGGVLALIYAPFAFLGATDLATLAVFTQQWEFNAALFGLLKPWMSDSAARAACGIALASSLAWYYRRYRRSASETVPRGDWVYGAMLASWPVVNPWYLLWLLPFGAVRPSAWAWTASVSVLLAYLTGNNLDDLRLDPFAHPAWVPPLEYGVILAAAAYDGFRRTRRSAGGVPGPTGR